MTHMVTRCPKCATAFRITATQLESAKGFVRCGSCLHIFKALDDLVNESSQDQEESLENSAFTTDADDALISDDMDEAVTEKSGYEFDGYVEIDTHPQTTSLFERDSTSEFEKDAEENEPVDESWVEHLLDEDQDSTHDDSLIAADFGKHSLQSEEEKNEIAKKKAERLSAFRASETVDYATLNKQFSTLYKAPVFSLVNEESHEENKNTENKDEENKDVLMRATKDEESDHEFDASALFANDDHEHTQKHPLKSQTAIHAHQDSRAELLMNIKPSPIELTANKLRSWYQGTPWAVLSVLAAITLSIQVAYFNFDQLSRIEPYRTAYQFVCPKLHCKVPPLIDTSKIIVYQLILRNHPDASNALKVDVMIRNDAPFEQPFPDLILAFSTMDNQPVASRRFKPKEYLGGELAGMEYIPSRQPVHITLELSHPGSDAVNYHISIAQ